MGWKDSGEGWIQTYTGKRINPLNPDPSQICIEDIAHALANTCRFSGHTRDFYSVAEHSYCASKYVAPENALQALMHDSAEAYLNDIAKPVKPSVSVWTGKEMIPFKRAEAHLLGVIFKKFGISREMAKEVEEIDMRLCYTEGGQLMPDVSVWNWYVKPIGGLRFECWPPSYAYVMFMTRYDNLSKAEEGKA
jgi:hypothetical protein